MPFVQNISEENQLLRVQGTKQVVKPGEIAEVTESELKTAKSYRRLFSHVDESGEVILSEAEKRSAASEEDRKAQIKRDTEAKKAAKKAVKAAKDKTPKEDSQEDDKDEDQNNTESQNDTENDENGEAEGNSTSQDSQEDEQK